MNCGSGSILLFWGVEYDGNGSGRRDIINTRQPAAHAGRINRSCCVRFKVSQYNSLLKASLHLCSSFSSLSTLECRSIQTQRPSSSISTRDARTRWRTNPQRLRIQSLSNHPRLLVTGSILAKGPAILDHRYAGAQRAGQPLRQWNSLSSVSFRDELSPLARACIRYNQISPCDRRGVLLSSAHV